LCRTLKVSRATYYRWLQPTAREMETNDLEKHITRIFYEVGESVYGARRVYQLLCKELSN